MVSLFLTWRPYLVEQRVEPPGLGELPRHDGDDIVACLAHGLYELGAEVLGGLYFFLCVCPRSFFFRREVFSKRGGGQKKKEKREGHLLGALCTQREQIALSSPLGKLSPGSLLSGASRCRHVFAAREHPALARAPSTWRPAAPLRSKKEKRSERAKK